MKYFTIPLAAVALLALSSCKGKVKAIEFDLVCQGNFQIVGSAQAGQSFFQSTGDITTNSASTFTTKNTAADRIDSAVITTLKLTITSPALEDFDLIEWVLASLTGTGLTELSVASDQPHTDNASKTLTFSAGSVDVKEFVKLDKFRARFSIKLDQDPLNNVSITVDITFKVFARENES